MRDIDETTWLDSYILFVAVGKADNLGILRVLLEAGAGVHAVEAGGSFVRHICRFHDTTCEASCNSAYPLDDSCGEKSAYSFGSICQAFDELTDRKTCQE